MKQDLLIGAASLATGINTVNHLLSKESSPLADRWEAPVTQGAPHGGG